MIQRLQTIEVEDFRAYNGRIDPVNLDGDIVLIHGYNGSGKTSLLHAIEYAVTGGVEHLAEFRSDYPDKLSYYSGGSSNQRKGRVRLVASTSASGQPHVIERTVGVPQLTAGTEFSNEAKRAYADRSYLSQFHLGRLLNIYQDTKGPRGATPIVEFIRDFLALDQLEAVEKGLHDVGHKARRDREFKAIGRIDHDLLTATTNEAARRVDATSARQALERTLEQLATAAPGAGVPPPETVPEIQTFDLPLRERSNRARAQAKQLTGWAELARAGDALGALPAAPPPTDPEAARSTLLALARAVNGVRSTLSLPDAAPGYEPPDFASSEPGPAHASLDNELQSWRGWVAKTREALAGARQTNDADVQRARQDAERLAALQTQAGQILTDLAALGDAARNDVEDAGSLREALATVLPHVHEDECPVCNRDYAEVDRGDLRAHVVAALEALGAQTERLRQTIDRREQLAVQRAETEAETAALVARSPQDRVVAFQNRAAELDRARAPLDTTATLLTTLSELADDYGARARSAAQRASWLKRQTTVTQAVRSSLEMLDPDAVLAPDAPIPDALLASLQDRAAGRIGVLTSQADALDRVLELAETARAQSSAAASAQVAFATAEAERARTAETSKNVKALVRRSNAVRKAAGDTTRKLIERTFDDHLNTLVNDIYFRLVRNEKFQPRITSKGTIRSLTAAVNAYVGDEKVAEDIASVVSSANLNTAALSLFIALHLASSARPRALVLDDPVQSMDDVHATNLAALFRSLAYHPTAPRQLVLAVHDKALFEYLALELGPTKEGDTLVEVRVTRESEDRVSVRSTPRVWQADRVRFG